MTVTEDYQVAFAAVWSGQQLSVPLYACAVS